MKEDEIRAFRGTFEAIETEISHSIIGQKDLIRQVLIAMVAGGNVLLEGMPGLGKTQLVKTIGKVMDLSFSRIQFTPDLMPADVTGTDVLTKEGGSESVRFRKGPVFANIVLADEINRATPKTQSALLEAMQEQTVTNGTTTFQLPAPFFVLATQNPLEMEGTYPLPEAQMDRFLFHLNVAFPSKEELLSIVNLTTGKDMPTPQKVCDGENLLALRSCAKEVPCATTVAETIMEIVLCTHPDYDHAPDVVKRYVRYGASPRGAQAILSTARVAALLAGRFHVAYDDIRLVTKSALRHRVFLNFEGAAEGYDADRILDAVIESVMEHA